LNYFQRDLQKALTRSLDTLPTAKLCDVVSHAIVTSVTHLACVTEGEVRPVTQSPGVVWLFDVLSRKMSYARTLSSVLMATVHNFKVGYYLSSYYDRNKWAWLNPFSF